MKIARPLLIALCAALALSGCSKKDPAKILHVYTWSDYLEESVISRFEEQFDCTVVVDTFDSNEALYAKLKAGADGYDVIFPSSYQAYTMRREGMLQNIDRTRLPNLRHVDPKYLARHAIDKSMSYSVPYMTGSTGIGYRVSALGEDFEPSWTLFDRADLKGRSTILNDMREAIGAALKSLGHSANTTNPDEIAAAAEVVKRWKGNIAKLENEGYKAGLASGEFKLVHGYSGDILQVIGEDESGDIAYCLPREGFIVWADDMAIPTGADNVPLAESFINFLHEPEIAALNINYLAYVAPNTAAYELVDEEIRADETIFIPAAMLEKAETIFPLGEETRALYLKAWDQILAH